jgi:uncharacterized membrane protein
MDEDQKNLTVAATYILFFVSGILFLILERKDKLVRFHAMQSTVLFGGLILIHIIFSQTSFLGWMVNQFVTPLTLILWVILLFKALLGEPLKLPYLGEWAEKRIE